MGHNIEHYEYPMNVNKDKVQKELDNYVAHADWQEGCGGLCRKIRWLEDKVYTSYDEAIEAIKRLDRSDYDQLAVKYYDPLFFSDDKKKELEEESKRLFHELSVVRDFLYPKSLKSALITCRNCGSKLSTKHLRGNLCPVCSTDLRPEHILKKISAAKNRWERADDRLKSYIDKHSKKDIKWLVKIEYHT